VARKKSDGELEREGAANRQTRPCACNPAPASTQKKSILIERPDEASGKFTLALEGTIQPGKEFTVQAAVTNPVPGQKLTMVLPIGPRAGEVHRRAGGEVAANRHP